MGLVEHCENLGWEGCINIDKKPESVLLVKNLLRNTKINEELKKHRWPNTRYYVDMVTAELEKNGELYRPRHNFLKPTRGE